MRRNQKYKARSRQRKARGVAPVERILRDDRLIEWDGTFKTGRILDGAAVTCSSLTITQSA